MKTTPRLVCVLIALSLTAAADQAPGANTTPSTSTAAPVTPAMSTPTTTGSTPESSTAKTESAPPDKANPKAGEKILGMSSDAVIGLVGAIVGAIIGALASLVTMWRAEATAKRKDEAVMRQQQDSARTTISIEIDHNLDLLRTYYSFVDNRHNPRELPGERFAAFPCPKWSLLMWEKQVPHLTVAFTPPTIAAIQELYQNLRSITNYQEVALSARQHDAITTELLGDCFALFRRSAERITAIGNPVTGVKKPLPDA